MTLIRWLASPRALVFHVVLEGVVGELLALKVLRGHLPLQRVADGLGVELALLDGGDWVTDLLLPITQSPLNYLILDGGLAHRVLIDKREILAADHSVSV